MGPVLGRARTPVSIHTPNEGSDSIIIRGYGYARVSIHTPNEGSDQRLGGDVSPIDLFQSTLPMKGVTDPNASNAKYGHVSIHTPNEGSDERG